MRQESVRHVLVILGLQAAFFASTPLHAQQAPPNSSSPQDKVDVATLIQKACDTNLPLAFRQFKKGQIERLMEDDQSTINLLKDDRNNSALYAGQAEQQALQNEIEWLRKQVTSAKDFLKHPCNVGPQPAPAPPPQAALATRPAPAQVTSAPTPTVAHATLATTPIPAAKVFAAAAAAPTPAPAQADPDPPAVVPTPAAAPVAPTAPIEPTVTQSLPIVSTKNLLFNAQILYVQSDAQALYITNSSDKPLTVNVTEVGSNPGDFPIESNNCTATLAPNSSCTVAVTFWPQDVGARTATLSVAIPPHDEAHQANLTNVTLSGTGNDPGTAPTLFTPLVRGLNVISGTADKKAVSVEVAVYDPKCDPKLLTTSAVPCEEVATGYTAGIDRSSGLFSIELRDKQRTGNEDKNEKSTDPPYKLKTGEFVVVTSAMPTASSPITSALTATTSNLSAPPEVIIPAHRVPVAVQQASYSESLVPWGNVVPTFSTGFVLSQNNNQFSQYNFFLDLNVETSYHLSSKHPDWRLNGFVDTQLTAIPAASCQTTSSTGASATSSSSATGSNCFNSSTIDQSFNSFLSAQKAAVVQGGFYLPILIPTFRWSYGGNTNSAFFGPIVKGGLQTVVNSTQTVTNNSSTSTSGTTSTTTTSTLVPSGFYGNWSAGIRIGHFKLWDSWNVAPEPLSYIDFTFGNWSSFEQCPSNGCTIDRTTGAITNLSHPFLMGVQGRFKVPETPLILGFDSITPIAGTGRSNFQFTVGIKTDLACVFNALKSSSTLNSSGSCQKTTPSSQSVAATPSALSISTSTLPDGTVGSPYSPAITAKGGTSPYSWSAPKGLPTGLSIDSSTGQITGTPTAAGNNNFTVSVTDSAHPKATATANLSIKVGTPVLTIATTTLPDGTVSSHYSQTISAKGGTAPYSWAQKDLPGWLSLNSSTGEISGTPRAASDSNFTVTVTDSANPKATATANLGIKVTATPAPER